MDPVTGAVVGGLINLGVNGIAEWLASSSSKEEKRQRIAILREYEALADQLPEDWDLVAREIERSEMEDVQRDPTQEAHLDEVQAGLMERVRGGGRSAQGQLAYERSRQRSAQEARSRRMGLVADAESRGLGPEAAYTDQLLAEQGDADRERMAGLQEAASAEEMAIQSLAEAGSMASQRSGRMWDQDAEVAGAIDDLRRFNAGEFNRFQLAGREDEWRGFDARMGITDRTARARGDLADMYGRRADRTRQQVGGIGQAIGYGVNVASQGGGVARPQAQSSAGRQAMEPLPYQPAMQPAVSQQRAAGYTTETDPRRRRAR